MWVGTASRERKPHENLKGGACPGIWCKNFETFGPLGFKRGKSVEEQPDPRTRCGPSHSRPHWTDP